MYNMINNPIKQFEIIKIGLFLLSFFALIDSQLAFGTTKVNHFPQKPANCFIHTKSTTKTQEVEEKSLSFKVKNKAECKKMRKILSDNFDPVHIQKSEARMEWKGK